MRHPRSLTSVAAVRLAWGALSVALLGTAVILAVYDHYAQQPPDWKPAPPSYPIPNGYDDFVAAAALVPVQPNESYSLTEAERAAVLARARLGLGRVCQAPSEGTGG